MKINKCLLGIHHVWKSPTACHILKKPPWPSYVYVLSCAKSYSDLSAQRRSYVALKSAVKSNADPELKEHAESIFQEAVTAVLPQQMVMRALQIEENTLTVQGKQYTLNHNVHIAAFGKAVGGMVRAAEEALGHHLVGGIASVPKGIQEALKQAGKMDLLPVPGSSVKMYEGAAKNIPDHDAFTTAGRIHELAQSLKEDDILLTLISGGGSALLPLPLPPITMEEMATVTKVMAQNSATIQQLNMVRKNTEVLKGGGLAVAAFPAKVISLILSDIIGDPVSCIASGPTYIDPCDTPQQCLELFQKMGIISKIPPSIIESLRKQIYDSKPKAWQDEEDVNKPESDLAAFHKRVQNVIVGSNSIALNAAFKQADNLGYDPYIMSFTLDGSARTVGTNFAHMAHLICETMHNKLDRVHGQKPLLDIEVSLIRNGMSKRTIQDITALAARAANEEKPVCILAGGETTVDVKGQGIGGRNQEMALSAGVVLHQVTKANPEVMSKFNVQFLSAGTDGQDGPCDAAGAFADATLVHRATKAGCDPAEYLDNNDSYTFFQKVENGRDHLFTGFTGTNVMDIQVILVKPLSL